MRNGITHSAQELVIKFDKLVLFDSSKSNFIVLIVQISSWWTVLLDFCLEQLSCFFTDIITSTCGEQKQTDIKIVIAVKIRL